MKFIKAFNNSCALVSNDEGKEEVVLGKGIAFGLKKGQAIDESRIQRSFLKKDEVSQVKSFGANTLLITNQVVQMVQPLLQVKFSDFQYLALADHIDFAILRCRDHIDVGAAQNNWEIRNLFPREYQVAQKVIAMINRLAHVKLPVSESVFMTYHLVNAKSNTAQVAETIQLANLLKDIINIVQLQYSMELDPKSFNYSRFISHLRICLVRFLRHQPKDEAPLDPALFAMIKSRYKKAYETAERIATYLQAKKGWQLDNNDKFYLILHIWRVTSRQKS